MKRKLNCILLIDDDMPTNYLNQLIVNKSGCAEKCVALESGQEALVYLRSKENGTYPQPELILLDVNMPTMDGWEFIEAYSQLSKDQQGGIVVVMLTTSLNPEDREKANSIPEVNDLIHKPLSESVLQEILDRYFPDYK